jgi:NitT/TauT family transport system ATP-binding protein
MNSIPAATKPAKLPASIVEGADARTRPADIAIALDHVDVELGGRRIIDDLTLDIAAGEFVCVVGPSGSGKTTALRLIAGLVKPSRGTVLFRGRPLQGSSRDIAVVFQDYSKALLPWRTAAQNVSLALEARNLPAKERPVLIAELLAKVGLQDHAGKYPAEMSGGMQQRLQIARCLAQKPAVLLMDEPFGALDAMTRQSLQDEILEIVRSSGASVFFVTHDLEEAIYLGDRIIGLRSNPGRIGATFQVDLPRPRDQLSTREQPEFLRLRRELFDFIKDAEHERGR